MTAQWLNNYKQKQANVTNPVENEAFPDSLSPKRTNLNGNTKLLVTESSIIQVPNNWSDTWNKFSISTDNSSWITMPGICTIKISHTNDVLQNKKKGYDYTTIKHAGANSKMINLNVKMSGYDHTVYRKNVAFLLPISSFNEATYNYKLYIQNELCTVNNINQVFLLGVEQATPEAGMFEMDFSFIEYHYQELREKIADDIKLEPNGIEVPKAKSAKKYLKTGRSSLAR
jgi:hypothetical protein